jgi:twinkle protein
MTTRYEVPRDEHLLPAKLTGKARQFFIDRGFDPDAIVLEAGVRGNDEVIQYPYYRDSVVVSIKERRPPKQFRQAITGCEQIMYGIDWCGGEDTIPNLVITEGEMDALAVRAAGHRHVVSVPNGSTQSPSAYLPSIQSLLDRTEIVTLAVDADQKGAQLEANLAHALGRGRCYRVVWPDGIKDANDALINLGGDALRELVVGADPFPVEGIIKASTIRSDIFLYYDQPTSRGYSTGWSLFDHLFTYKGGQLTIVTGPPSSGKSEWIDALMVNLAESQGMRFAVYSPEYHPPERYVQKWLEKYTGQPFTSGPSPRIAREELDDYINWVDDHLSMLLPKEPNLDEILELAKIQKLREDIAGLVIDPYAYLSKGLEGDRETEFVRRMLQQLVAFARDHFLHVIVVAHPSKQWNRLPEDQEVWVVRPYEISGSAHWFNMADNIISVARNKTNELEPVQVHVQKVRYREVGALGRADFRFDKPSGRYTCERVVTAAGEEYKEQEKLPAPSYVARSLG